MTGKSRKGITPIIAVVLLIVIAFVAVGAVGTLVTGVIDDAEVGDVGPQADITGMENSTNGTPSEFTSRVGLQINPTGESVDGEFEVRVDEGDGISPISFYDNDSKEFVETLEISISDREVFMINKEWPADNAPTSFTVEVENVESGDVITGECELTDTGDEVC